MFAKIFGTDDDQILVLLTVDKEEPEIRVYCKPPGGGVCNTAAVFLDKDGDAKAEKAFHALTEAQAREMIKPIYEMFESPDDGN